MSAYYIPYARRRPAVATINGHRLTILSHDRDSLEDNLEVFGGDTVKELVSQSPEEEKIMINHLANTIRGGVVVAPDNVKIEDVLKNLETQLPWLQ